VKLVANRMICLCQPRRNLSRRLVREFPSASASFETKSLTSLLLLDHKVNVHKRKYVRHSRSKQTLTSIRPLVFSTISQENVNNRFFQSLKRCFSKNATHYEVLGVKQNATSEEIRAAFLNKSKEFHPDVNKSGHDYHEKIVQINAAYSVLSKALPRKHYDSSLRTQTYPTQYTNSTQTSKPAGTSTSTYRPDYDREGIHFDEKSGQFYDKQFYSMRDKSKDAYYESQPYHGVKYFKKGYFSNAQVVMLCIMWMTIGSGLFFSVIVYRTSVATKFSNERDNKIKEFLDARKDPFYKKEIGGNKGVIDKEEKKE